MVFIVSVVDLPMILDQIVDSFHSTALSGLWEAPVTLKYYAAGTGWCIQARITVDQLPPCPASLRA